MVATEGEVDLDTLSAWKTTLTSQAEGLRAEIRMRQTDLARVEERVALVTKLIEVETRAQVAIPEQNDEIISGVAPASPAGMPTPASAPDLEGAVEKILRAEGKPLHISNIQEALVAQGVPIPGRGDEANIIVRLRRFEDRFTRTARGTYGLTEWHIPAVARKAGKRRRARTR
jgi:hypothetical protein